MKMVLFATYASPHEAYLLKGKLSVAEIECFLANEYFATLMPHFYQILGSGVQVYINEKDIEKAICLLGVEEFEGAVCSKCQSKNVKSSLGGNKLKKYFFVFFSLFNGMPFNNIKVENFCSDCGKRN